MPRETIYEALENAEVSLFVNLGPYSVDDPMRPCTLPKGTRVRVVQRSPEEFQLIPLDVPAVEKAVVPEGELKFHRYTSIYLGATPEQLSRGFTPVSQ